MCSDEKKLILSLSLLTTGSAWQGGKQSASDYRWALLPNWSHHLYYTASTLFLLGRKRANTDLWPLNSSFIVCLSSFLFPQSAPNTLLHHRKSKDALRGKEYATSGSLPESEQGRRNARQTKVASKRGQTAAVSQDGHLLGQTIKRRSCRCFMSLSWRLEWAQTHWQPFPYLHAFLFLLQVSSIKIDRSVSKKDRQAVIEKSSQSCPLFYLFLSGFLLFSYCLLLLMLLRLNMLRKRTQQVRRRKKILSLLFGSLHLVAQVSTSHDCFFKF